DHAVQLDRMLHACWSQGFFFAAADVVSVILKLNCCCTICRTLMAPILAGVNRMYGNASFTAVMNSLFVACSTMNEAVAAKPVVSTVYCAFTNPWTCASSSLSG